MYTINIKISPARHHCTTTHNFFLRVAPRKPASCCMVSPPSPGRRRNNYLYAQSTNQRHAKHSEMKQASPPQKKRKQNLVLPVSARILRNTLRSIRSKGYTVFNRITLLLPPWAVQTNPVRTKANAQKTSAKAERKKKMCCPSTVIVNVFLRICRTFGVRLKRLCVLCTLFVLPLFVDVSYFVFKHKNRSASAPAVVGM